MGGKQGKATTIFNNFHHLIHDDFLHVIQDIFMGFNRLKESDAICVRSIHYFSQNAYTNHNAKKTFMVLTFYHKFELSRDLWIQNEIVCSKKDYINKLLFLFKEQALAYDRSNVKKCRNY